MFFTNFDLNFKPNTLKILAIASTIIGILFIFLADYIGNFAIRIAMLVVAVIVVINIKMTYSYSGKLKKSSDILTLLGAIVVFIFPQLVVFILGLFILYFCVIALYNIIKSKDYSDKVKIIISIIGLIFSVFCIFYSKGILNIVIKLLGAILVAVGCFCFYKYINSNKNKKEELKKEDVYKFENAEEIKEDEQN